MPVDPETKDLPTPRLRLEMLLPRHASALFDGLQSPRLYEFINDVPPTSVEALEERYTWLSRRISPDGTERWLNWAVLCTAEQRYLGYVQATVQPGAHASIAYVFFPESWGRGYAREALGRMIEYLVETYGISELRATVDVRNVRSIALLERLGFVRMAVRKDAERINGVLSDEAEYRRPCG